MRFFSLKGIFSVKTISLCGYNLSKDSIILKNMFYRLNLNIGWEWCKMLVKSKFLLRQVALEIYIIRYSLQPTVVYCWTKASLKSANHPGLEQSHPFVTSFFLKFFSPSCFVIANVYSIRDNTSQCKAITLILLSVTNISLGKGVGNTLKGNKAVAFLKRNIFVDLWNIF